jgi:hypothetical protein
MATAHVKVAEHLTVRDGVLASSEIVTDGAAFAAFIAGASPAAPR